jgi:dipeptidyl aminopeptidase/acylaminoacyl peptidase
MSVPYWEDVEAHLRNSPLHEVNNLETPLLMAFGNEDGTVEWWQGTVFYNYARRAQKQMVLLVYEGENHGFSSKPNQIDYHRRILEWFGHYLKGEAAPKWITEGVPFEGLEAEKKRVAGEG